MANNTTNFTLKLKTEGLENAQKGTKQIRDNLEGAQAAAQGIGTSGSRRVASSAAARPTGAAGASAGITGGEVQEYNRARGAGGASGGTARDFADQARGLGGLVRIYATLAANVFALGAAFSALSRAMDTTNMVRGLDQLGAASGVALGGLSKRLYLATEGAVSLREAMEATVKASSAGLNTNQILQLGDVAKKASQALGLNMTDALSRLSRGISKLEPELLDELGIFVKIDDATSKYALSVGKSTSALTDFERRQAFANAVLEQGIKKFGDINIESNPYSKLAASFQNLVQTGLELINKVLGPIARIFADNSALLAAAIGLIGVKILKMAIPAFGEWQQQLTKTAETAKNKAAAINTAFGEAWVDRWETRLKLPELRQGVQAATQEIAKLGGLPAGANKATRAGYEALMRGEEMTSKQISQTKGEITKKINEVNSLSAAEDAQSKKRNAQLQKEITQLQALIALNKKRQDLTVAEGKIETAAGKTTFLGPEWQRNKAAAGASTTAIALGELSALPAQTMERGVGSALSAMKANLDKAGVGFVKKWSTMVVGAFASVTVAVGTFAAAVQAYLGIFLLIGTAIYGALNYFSNTKKEAQLTSEAVDRLTDASKNVTLTLEKLQKVNPLERMSIESIQARANALNELGQSVSLVIDRSVKELEKMNWASFTLDLVSRMWGGDVVTKMAEGLSDTLVQAFRTAESGEATDGAKKSIEAIIGTSIESSNLTRVLKELAASGDTEKLKQVAKIIQDMGNAAGVSAAKGTELKQSLSKITTGIQEFNKSLMPTDQLAKFATDAIDGAKKFKLALDDSNQSLNAMREIVKTPEALSIFPPEVASELLKYKSELEETAKQIAKVSELTEEEKNRIKTLTDQMNSFRPPILASEADVKAVEATKDAFAKKIKEIESRPLKLKAEIQATRVDPIKKVFDTAVEASLLASAEKMGARIAADIAKAQTTVANTIGGLLGDTSAGIKLRADVERQNIQASLTVAQQSFNLAIQVERLRDEMEANRLLEERRGLGQGDKSSDLGSRKAEIDKRLKELETRQKVMDASGKGFSSKQLIAGAKSGGIPFQADVVGLVQKYEGLAAQLAQGKAQLKATDIKEEIDLVKNRQKLEAEMLQNSIAYLANTKQKLDLEKQAGTITEQEYNRKLSVIEAEQIQANFTKRRKESEDEYTNLVTLGKKLVELKQPQLAEEIYTLAEGNKLLKDRRNTEEQSLELRAQQIKQIDRNLATELKTLEFQNSMNEAARELQKIKEDTASSLRDIELQTAKETGKYTDEYINQLYHNAEIFKINEEAKRREADATAKYQVESAKLSTQLIAEVMKSGATEDGPMSEEGQRIAARLAALQASNAAEISGIQAVAAARAKSTEEIYKAKTAQDEFNKSIEQLKGLESVFGPIAGAFADIAVSLDQAAKNQKKYANEQARLQAVLDAGGLAEEDKLDTEKALAQLKSKSVRQELADNAKIAGDTKKLFKEKTFAYKALAAIEKANHIASLAMNAQTIISNLATLPAKIAGGVSQLFSQGGFAGFAGAAAFLALMASLGFRGGKSVSAPPGGFTAEEQQKVQGTGEAYVDGKKVTRAGALAEDPTAKAESVTKALNIFTKASFENLEYSNKMLTALKMIEQNTRGLSSAMMRSLGPDRTGSLAGGIPQGELRGNYFSGGKGAVAGAGLGAGLGYLAGGSALAMGAIGGAVSTLSMGLITAVSGAILPVIGLFLAKPLGKLLGSVFGGKVTQSVEDFGIRVQGTFEDIIAGVDKSVEEFANVKTVRKGGWFRSDKTTFSTQAREASEAIKDYVGNLFMGMKDSLVAAGDVLGKDVRGFFQTYVVQGFKVSAKNLSGEELAKAIEGEVSIAFNAAAAAAFPEFEKFAEPFEEAGETIIRLARQVQVFDLAMKTMGGALSRTINISLDAATITETKTTTTQVGTTTRDVVTDSEEKVTDYISDFTYTVFTRSISRIEEPIYNVVTETITRPLTDAEKQLKRVEISNALIAAAGGLDKFTEQVNFYAENFLTDAERLAPIQAALSDELNRLGLSSVDTRDEFKATINALDLTTTEGQQLYTALMAIAPAFALVYKEGTKVLSAEEFKVKLYDQETRILELLGRDQDLLNRKREKEREEIRKYGGAQKDVLLANQEYIYALEDENKIRQKLIQQRDKEKKALEDTIKTLQSAIDALQNYKKNLLTSDLTTLTPLQQYEQNKTEFDTLSAVLASSTSTAEEKATAASKLPAAADKLLNSSRTLFASGAQYQADFDRVLGVIDSSTQFLEAQKTDAQKQLDELIASTAFLDSIEDNTKTTADLLKELEDAERKTEEKRVLAVRTAEQWQVDVLGVLKRAYDSPSVTTATEIGNVASDAPTTASVSVDSGSAASSSGTSAVADTGTNATVGNNTVATPVIEAPVIVVTAAVSQPLIASINNLVSSVDGVATEVSGLRTDSAEQTQAIVYSTYDSSDKNALSISTAVVEEKSISTFTASNSPTVDSDRVSTIDR